MASAVEHGKLAYDDRVAALWPAYGANGKGEVTVAQLLSHQDGLPGFDGPADPAIWFDQQAVLDRLAAQAPMWPPGSASGYHPVTVGYLANEMHRRADGRSLGQALRQDFAEPFGLDLWIGLPLDQHDRVATLRKPSAAASLGPVDPIKSAAFLDKGSAPGGRGSTEWRTIEIPLRQPARHGAGSRPHPRRRRQRRRPRRPGRPVTRRARSGHARAHSRPGPGPALCDQLGRRPDAQPGPRHLRPQPRCARPLRLGVAPAPSPTRRRSCRPPMS